MIGARFSGKHVYFRVTASACVLFAGLYIFCVAALYRHWGERKVVSWTAAPRGDHWVVRWVDPQHTAAAKLIPGDRILAVDGDESAGRVGPFRVYRLPLGERYELTIDRGGKRMAIALASELQYASQPRRLIYLLCSLASFALGIFLGFSKPQDSQARLFSCMSLALAGSLLIDLLGPAQLLLQGYVLWVWLLISSIAGWQFPLLYRFFSHFPTGEKPGGIWSALLPFLYAGFGVIQFARLMMETVRVFPGEGLYTFFDAHLQWYRWIAGIERTAAIPYLVLAPTLALLVTARNYRRLREPGLRRRVRWVVAGVFVALVPWLSIMVGHRVLGWIPLHVFEAVYPWVFVAALAAPFSMAYAVWKNQLFDVRVAIRRGVQYLLARSALRALLLVPLLALTATVAVNRHRTVAELLTGASGVASLLLLAAILLGLRFRQRLEGALDRKFFREAYNQEQLLLDLIERVKQQDSIPAIAPLVTAQIDAALHSEAIYLFYREQDASEVLVGHSLLGMRRDLRISPDHSVMRIMDAVRSVQEFPFRFEAALPPAEREWLEGLGARLLVPVTGNRRMVGLLILGAKKSDEPYTKTDRTLLAAIAAQIGVVYENLWLEQRAGREDRIKREVLARLDDHGVNLLKECPGCGACYDSGVTLCPADGQTLTMTMPVERTIDGKYHLDRLLGHGGMGAVYQATDVKLERPVAVKVLMGSLYGNQVALRRFEREARAAARLDHPNITRVYDCGSIGADGAYMVMELLPGHTWREELKRAGALETARAAEWFRQILAGVGTAHRAGIVHRDLKPENVMVCQAGGGEVLKIMDFGLAKLQAMADTDSTTQLLTAAGAVMGTLGYMAPEQLSGAPADERADLFALGVMVAEALTGQRPFTGRTVHEVMAAVMQQDYTLPGDAEAVRALNGVLRKLLAKKPADRWASVAEVEGPLLDAMRRCPPLAVPSSTVTWAAGN